MSFVISSADVANVLRSMQEPSDEVVAEGLLGQLDQSEIAKAGEGVADPFESVALAYQEIRRQLRDRNLVPIDAA